MAKLTDNITIDAPRDAVWEILADFGGVAKFNPTVSASKLTSERSQGIGATRECRLRPFGVIEERAIHWHEGHSYTVEITDTRAGAPPVRNALGRFDVSAVNGGTEVQFTLDYDLGMGPLGPIADALLVRSQFRRVLRRTLQGLKETAEDVGHAGAVLAQTA